MVGPKDGKIKRPDRELYVPPALRDELHKNEMADIKYNYASEAMKRQNYSSDSRDRSWRTTNIVPEKISWGSSSSSNPRNTSDESYKNDDSSDYEECSTVATETMSDEEVSEGTNEKKSNDHWNEERRKPAIRNHGTETEHYWTNIKRPNRILMEHKDNSDSESHANKLPDFESNSTKHDRKPFLYYDESSTSDIDTLINDCLKMDKESISTPHSDIDEAKGLDAAKFDPEEENGLESTLLCQSGTTINMNRNKCDYNQDPSSVTSHSTDFTATSGNNYIPPPVPRPAVAFPLPPIHRLPIRVSKPVVLFELGQVSSQKRPQSSARLENPRFLYPPSLQLYSHPSPLSTSIPSISTEMVPNPRYVLSPRLQLKPSRASYQTYIPSSIPPILPPKEKINHPRPLQDASKSTRFNQRRLNSQGLESDEEQDSFYIPPPVPPQQQVNRIQQVRYLNQRENVHSCRPSSISSVEKALYDGKIWPQNSKQEGDYITSD